MPSSAKAWLDGADPRAAASTDGNTDADTVAKTNTKANTHAKLVSPWGRPSYTGKPITDAFDLPKNSKLWPPGVFGGTRRLASTAADSSANTAKANTEANTTGANRELVGPGDAEPS